MNLDKTPTFDRTICLHHDFLRRNKSNAKLFVTLHHFWQLSWQRIIHWMQWYGKVVDNRLLEKNFFFFFWKKVLETIKSTHCLKKCSDIDEKINSIQVNWTQCCINIENHRKSTRQNVFQKKIAFAAIPIEVLLQCLKWACIICVVRALFRYKFNISNWHYFCDHNVTNFHNGHAPI